MGEGSHLSLTHTPSLLLKIRWVSSLKAQASSSSSPPLSSSSSSRSAPPLQTGYTSSRPPAAGPRSGSVTGEPASDSQEDPSVAPTSLSDTEPMTSSTPSARLATSQAL